MSRLAAWVSKKREHAVPEGRQFSNVSLQAAVPPEYQEIILTAPDKKAKPSLMSSPLDVKKSFRPTSPETAMTVFYYSDDEPKKKMDSRHGGRTRRSLNWKIDFPQSSKLDERKSNRVRKKGLIVQIPHSGNLIGVASESSISWPSVGRNQRRMRTTTLGTVSATLVVARSAKNDWQRARKPMMSMMLENERSWVCQRSGLRH